MCRNRDELHGLLGHGVFLTYYDQIGVGIRPPDNNHWVWTRNGDEERWFSGYKEKIYYAVLSLSEQGASGWGPISLIFADPVLEQRATVGEENAIRFVQKLGDKDPIPPGYRAKWKDRGKLCVAKLGGKLVKDTSPDQFANVLLQNSGSRTEADFVEVHIYKYDVLTIDSVARIRIPKVQQSEFAEVCERLKLRNPKVEVEFVEEAKT